RTRRAGHVPGGLESVRACEPCDLLGSVGGDKMTHQRLRISIVSLMLGVSPFANAGGMSGDLLLSSAWCHLTYNKTTGYSHSKRVHFNANGTYSTGSRGEGYSSGSGGSMASQRDSAASGVGKVM